MFSKLFNRVKRQDEIKASVKKLEKEKYAFEQYRLKTGGELLNREMAIGQLSDAERKKFYEEKTAFEAQAKEHYIAITKLAEEKTIGFPWLAEAYADFLHLQDLKAAAALETKANPAPSSADRVREIAQQRRTAERQLRINQYQLSYYEALFPWLIDLRELDDECIRQTDRETANGPESDPARKWLTSEEYNNLSTTEKYQRALDRYSIRQKTKWEIGRDYERYIGYSYEINGWRIQYHGIIEGFSDLGRDLIATRVGQILIIQCKNWAQHKTIHEKHIFQLYGTLIAYRVDNPSQAQSAQAAFITSTLLSDRAKQFADMLKIQYSCSLPLQKYPCIKCNINPKTSEKIYHLPFDQQYDNVVIDLHRGEQYVSTIKEADVLGFRRAFRWSGNQQKS